MVPGVSVYRLLIGALLGSCLLVGCGPASTVTGSWKNPDGAGRPYRNVLVAALSDDASARQLVETELVNRLQRQGIQATRSIDLFPASMGQGHLPPRTDIIQTVRRADHDAVLTASLIDSNADIRYVPGTIAYAPVSRHPTTSNFSGYYSHLYSQVFTPGYYVDSNTYFLETNLYDAASEQLRWSAQSETYDPRSLRSFAKRFARLTLSKLSQDGML